MESLSGYDSPYPVAPIAICGIALRLPGGITNPSQFWDFLIAKGDARSRVPDSRYNVSSFHSKSGRDGNIKTEYGYFLDESIDLGTLDTSFFSFTKSELKFIDPHQRQLLEVVRECLESAGEAHYRGKDIGCYVGSFGDDWYENMNRDLQMPNTYSMMIATDYAIPNRISYEYDLRGPSMSIRTACSSTVVGLHQACLALGRGDCSAAIIGGVNLIMAPTMSITMTTVGVLSPDGSCKTFNSDADGYGRGEAITAIYIKRLSDALADGNPIRAIIRGTSVNSDGKSTGLNVPSSAAHEAVIRKAYAVAGIANLSDTGFIECHGTGTPVGDPIELEAVANVFGEKGIYVGAVKPNFGHSEGASGLTSIIKTVLALENRTIPPNIKFTNRNPNIPSLSTKLHVPTEPIPWPEDRCLRASVNSFGIGGINGHAVLESANVNSFGIGGINGHAELESAKQTLLANSTIDERNALALVLCSANTLDSLRRLVVNNQKYLADYPMSLHDLAYTLGARREHLPHRAFYIGGKDIKPKTSSFVKAPSLPPNLVMIFTGQGAQWPQMGLELYESNNVFRKSLLDSDNILKSLPEAPNWSIIDQLMKPEGMSDLQNTIYSQPICTALQIALVDALRSINVRPYAVVGHSSGEMAAAYAAGRLTASEAMIAAFYRGVVSGKVTRSGGMAAVGLGSEEAKQVLIPGVRIACENSTSSVTISGDLDQLEKIIDNIKMSRPEVLIKRLKVDKAYHSHHMEEVGPTYATLTEHFIPDSSASSDPSVLFFSTVTGQLLDDTQALGARYWQSNLECPVLFHTAILNLLSHKSLYGDNELVFLEVGPHAALLGPVRQTLNQASLDFPYLSCLVRPENSAESFLSAIGHSYLQNASLDFPALTNPVGSAKVLTDLPLYPWEHTYSSLYEPRTVKEWRFLPVRKHELLGLRVIESTPTEPSWRNLLLLENVPWLRDHNVGGDIIFPCAAYVAMVGEAVRQLESNGFCGFTLRNMTISAAMVLANLKSTEIITSLRQHHQPGSGDSPWWDFTVSSHNGTSWSKHCTGQVRARRSFSPVIEQGQTTQTTQFSRTVVSSRWYKVLQRIGHDYGPAFRGMRDIVCSTTRHAAACEVFQTVPGEIPSYPVHPTMIDSQFQLCFVAIYKGISRKLDTMLIPIKIGEIDVYDSASSISATAFAIVSLHDQIEASAEALNYDGTPALRVKNVKLNAFRAEDSTQIREHHHVEARLYWQPDIDFLNLENLIRPCPDREVIIPLLDELANLCIQESLSRLKGVKPQHSYLQKFRKWLETQAFVPSADSLDSIIAQISSTSVSHFATTMMRVLDNIVQIFRGDVEPIEILMEDDGWTRLYDYLNRCDNGALFQSLGHYHPTQRILEIGAGTGGTTNKILSNLVNLPNSQIMYSNYTFTDISPGFFPAAKERFKSFPKIAFATLDITKDPLTQGFEPESFDLIVAANVLHATPNLHDTLVHVRKLLHPQGKLFLEELCPKTKFANYIMGVLPGWWLGEADGREGEPYVLPQRWGDELRKAGFQDLGKVGFDAPSPFHINAFMLATPQMEGCESGRCVTLLCDNQSWDTARQLEKQLTIRGFEASIHHFGNTLPQNQDIIAVVDIYSPFFGTMDSTRLSGFQSFLSDLHAGVLWVTRSSQIHCEDPGFAQTIGVARTIRSEFGIDFATCEIDRVEENDTELVIDVFENFQLRRHGQPERQEYEYSIYEDTINIGRFRPLSAKEELIRLKHEGQRDLALCLDIGEYGRLDTLEWTISKQREIREDEVEVDVRAVGLNFQDILIALGILDMNGKGLGIEASGIVRRVGSNVQDLSTGDRVFVLGSGCFSTIFITSAKLCVRIPNNLTFEKAATMAMAFSTAIYSLVHIGQLDKTQSVLIHSACGGVGIAAIQVSKMLGATIYATVGNEEKVQYLMNTFDIPRHHIFNSRDTSFHPGIMKATGGRGIDLVLNSLSGELLHASWECVAECGKLLEIGKRDIIDNGVLAMRNFGDNRGYCGVDIAHLIETKPDYCTRLLKTIVKHYSEGLIHPIEPLKTFTADNASECFRSMQRGQHIGKFVLFIDPGWKPLKLAHTPKPIIFQSDASYLLAGGLGGLGRTVSTWMVEHNARHLIYLSRSAGTSDTDKGFFQELESQGCSVTVVTGSVSNVTDVEKAISLAPAPLKGIFNMSMVLRDQSLLKMTYEDWSVAISPKVHGTWNLHKASLSHELDFFLLFSSISGILGFHGQANYSSGNTFLDAFVQYRHSCNLVASVVDIGAVLDVGFVANNTRILERMPWLQEFQVEEQMLLDALTLAVHEGCPRPGRGQKEVGFTNPSQVIVGLKKSMHTESSSYKALQKDRRFAAYLAQTVDNTSVSQSADPNKLNNLLSKAASDSALLFEVNTCRFIATEIAKYIFDLLMKPVQDESEIDISRSLQDVGLDSVTAVEIRSWCRTTFGVDIGVLEMLALGSFLAFGEYVVDGLAEKYGFRVETS